MGKWRPRVDVLAMLTLLTTHGCRRQSAAERDESALTQLPSAPTMVGASAAAPAVASPSRLGSAPPQAPSVDQGADDRVDGVSFDTLPVVAPTSCAQGGRSAFVVVPRALWSPIVTAALKAWPEGDTWGPRSCVGSVRMRCGADFDGTPGAELLVEISYQLPQEGVSETERPLRPSCSSSERVPQAVIVAMSELTPERPEWTSMGIVGYSTRGVGEGGTVLRIKRFVTMPDGTTGVYARAFNEGFAAQEDVVRVYGGERAEWRTAARRQLPAPPDPRPPAPR